MVAPRSKQFDVAGIILGGGPGPTTNGQLGWATGLGALTHVQGPSDQNLSVQAGASRAIVAGPSLNVGTGVTPSTDNGDIVAGDSTRTLSWDASTGALKVSDSSSTTEFNWDHATAGGRLILENTVSGASVGGPLVLRSWNSAGAGVAGLGSSLSFNGESGTEGTPRTIGSIRGVWRDVTVLNDEYGQMEFRIAKNGAPAGGALPLVLGNTASPTGNTRAEFANSTANTPTVIIDMDQESLQVGQSAPTPGGAGDITAGDGTREFVFDASGAAFEVQISDGSGYQVRTGWASIPLSVHDSTLGNVSSLHLRHRALELRDTAPPFNYHLQYNGATGVYNILDSTANVVRHQINDTGFMSVGDVSSSTAAAIGDLWAGDGTRSLEWDASAGRFLLKQSASSLQETYSGTSLLSVNNGSVLHRLYAYGSGSPDLLFGRFGGTIGARTQTLSGDRLGQIEFQGLDNAVSPGGRKSLARISAFADGNVTTTSAPGRLEFYTTASGSTTITKRWQVGNAGHLTAGTDNSWDIGSEDGGTTDLRPRTIYVGTSVVVGDTVTITTDSIDASGALTIGGSTATSLTLGRAGLAITNPGDLIVTGDLTVNGTTTTVNSEVQTADNHILLNSEYTADAPQTSGLILNVDPAATSFSISGIATNVITVVSGDPSAVLSAGDFILIQNPATAANAGIFEVLSTTVSSITIDTTPAEVFSGTGLTDDATTQGTVVGTGIALWEASTAGVFQRAFGTSAPLTRDVSLGAGTVSGSGALTVQSSGSNDLTLSSANTGLSAIDLNATSGGIRLTASGERISMSSTGVITASSSAAVSNAINLTASAGGIDMDGVLTSHFTVTGSNQQVTVSAGGGGATQEVRLISAGTGASAVNIDATAGGITLDATGAISLDSTSTSSNFTLASNDAATTTLTIQSTNSGAGVGNVLMTADGSLDLRAAVSLDISDDNQAATVNVGTGSAAKTVTVGSVNTTSSLTMRTGTGAMTFTAGGIFDVNATGAVTIDSTGAVSIGTSSASALNLGAGGSHWQINSSGHLLAQTDNTHDIGAFGATRPRTIYASRGLSVTGLSSATYYVDGQGTANTYIGAQVVNASSGASAEARVRVGADSGVGGILAATSSGFTSLPSTVQLRAADAGNGIAVITEGAQKISFYTNGTGNERWRINANGHLVAGTDDSWDIGSEDGGTTDLRPRRVYVGTEVVIGDTITISGTAITGSDDTGVVIGAPGAGSGQGSVLQTASFTTTERGYITTPANGMVLYDSTLNQLMGRINGAWTDIGGAGGGLVTGTASIRAGTVDAISGVTQATSTTVSSFNVRSHPDGSETGQQFEFKVPDDYDSGDITINITYRMSTAVASPNNVVRLETAAEIAPAAGGTIDTATYPLTQSDLTTLENTNWSRTTVLTLTEGDFAAADSILVKIKRRGAHANDDHTGAFQIMTYDYSYTSQISNRNVTQNITLFDASDETSATAGTKSSFNTLDFSGSVDNEQQFQVIVPDNWDESSDLHIQATYAMGAAEASKTVILHTEYEVADVSGGTITVSGTETHTERPPNDTNVRRTVSLRGIPASALGKGDSVLVKLKRRGSVDTHTSTFQLLAVSVYTGLAPQTGFSEVTITQDYLEAPVFNAVSGTTSSDLEYPTFSGDFETWAFMTSTTAAARIDVGFSGRLTDSQTSITEIKIPIKGDIGSQFQVKIYAEGSGASPVYTGSLTTVSASNYDTRTVLTLLSGDLSAQPTGEKRYHVVVEATLDNTEELRVGMPFVKQE